MSRFVLAYSPSGDWEGLYKDGKLVCEGHSLTLDQLAAAAGLEFDHLEADEGWIEERGNFPLGLANVKTAEGD